MLTPPEVMARQALGGGLLGWLGGALARRAAPAAAATDVVEAGRRRREAAPPIRRLAAPWPAAFRSVAQTMPEGRALTLDGPLEENAIAGTFYQNGPGAFESPDGRAYDNMLDGDGLVRAWRCSEGGVSYASRFIDTSARREEARTKRRCFGGIGHVAPGGLWGWLTGHGIKNVANTSIAYFDACGGPGDRDGRDDPPLCLAHYEGGVPHLLDPDTLATLGPYDLDGLLTASSRLSAHPHLTADGTLVNFGFEASDPQEAVIYCKEPGKKARRAARLRLHAMAMPHDFAVADGCAFLVVSPATISWRAARDVLFTRIPPLAALRWDEGAGTRVHVVDLATGVERARYRIASCGYVQHIANAFAHPAGGWALDVCAFPNFDFVEVATHVLRGQVPSPVRATLKRLHLSAPTQGTDAVVEARPRDRSAVPEPPVTVTTLSRTPIEYPCVDPREYGRQADYYYGLTWRDGPLPSVPVRIDTKTGIATKARLGREEAAGACSVTPKPDGKGVHLLTIVSHTQSGQSRMHVYDGNRLSRPPRAVSVLPQPLPVGFHSTFVPESNGLRRSAVP